MYTFRHKTKTKLYTVVVPLLLIIQLAVAMLFLSACGADLAASAGNAGTTDEQVTVDVEDTESLEDVDLESLEIEDDEELLEEDVSEPEEQVMIYVLNTNTHKFHYPDCRSVKQMKDKNKLEVEATREEVIANGYDPCGNCNP